MPSYLTFYLCPDCLPDELHWEGPDVYRIESGQASDLLSDRGQFEGFLHEALTPSERAILAPGGFKQEHDKLPLLDPVEVRQVLLKAYDAIAQRLCFDAAADTESHILFRKIRRDVAEAVLVCERAIEQDCSIYIGLW